MPCSDLWRALGFPEYAWWDEEWEELASQTFGSYYNYFWLEKYDYDPVQWTIDWEEEMRELEEQHRLKNFFDEVQKKTYRWE